MGHPYATMKEGCLMAKRQINGRAVRLIPYIQAFSMNMSYSGLTLKDYIIAQLKAVEDAGADGYFFWNAANDYRTTWAALDDFNEGKIPAKAVIPFPTTPNDLLGNKQ